MENPFKKMLHNEELPEVLKNKVLKDVAMIKLSIDLADLFMVKYPSTITDLLSGGVSKKETEKN
ncbi:hypothetical protein [Tenacibaculum piscium]|uniref:Uncharacterized protein n=1 Tax=Tenacibaculum piscium TaxID=1458515 RepID=A0A2H1YJ02_9FLAO|nr:hypothetical protein [Tenacibaculum piscium]MBE7628669.1 hypothetical protein [Tenacibaculum piscium]MBE7669810.1 hypothetical protein [Tenacibaculum piscium]MBE7684602.1 hypothetical protein [Tenacibaculum piscium]MBE7689222.1 hypothetical protein [Tenacibaculum piscium]MCG8182899.1 hypothetical protein [Tenacibaculum piscium]